MTTRRTQQNDRGMGQVDVHLATSVRLDQLEVLQRARVLQLLALGHPLGARVVVRERGLVDLLRELCLAEGLGEVVGCGDALLDNGVYGLLEAVYDRVAVDVLDVAVDAVEGVLDLGDVQGVLGCVGLLTDALEPPAGGLFGDLGVCTGRP